LFARPPAQKAISQRGYFVTYKGIAVFTMLMILVSACFVHSATIQLPQTGQTKCYNWQSPWQEIPCAGEGQDGTYQKGVPWPSSRFTTIHCSATGPCPHQAFDCDADPATDIIKDNLTGLVWSTEAGATQRTWHQALSDAADLELCGKKDWRLPNVNELQSLFNEGVDRNDWWLQDQGFAFIPFGDYHTSTPYAPMPAQIWYVDIGYRYTGSQLRTGSMWVLPVRGPDTLGPAPVWKTGQTLCYDDSGNPIVCTGTGQDGNYQAGVAWPSSRFSVGTGSEAGCVTDNLTRLMWAKTPDNTQRDWHTGLTNANTLSLCGYDDWRVPNIIEQRSLVNYQEVVPGDWLNSNGFVNAPVGRLWTSTTFDLADVPNSNYAAYTDISDGTVINNMPKTTSTLYVWAVRSTMGDIRIIKTGSGSGTVASNPKGISCGTDCAEAYKIGATVTLTAAAKPGSSFTGWSGGGCAGSGTCTVTLSEDNSITATFTAIPTLTVSPRSLNFGAMKKDGTSQVKVVTIKNTGTAGSVLTFPSPPDTTGANAAEFSIDTTSCTNPLGKNESCTISLTYNPVSWNSPKSAMLNIYSDAPKNGTISAKLAGTSGPPNIAISPATLGFGSIGINPAVPPVKIITISNSGISDLTFDSPTPGDNSFTVAPYVCPSIPKGKTCKISISFDPASAGVKDCDLTITSIDPAKGTKTVKLKGTGK
jgi:hypothetical protein